jgi:peptide/nickel transport system substrate-binding protein
MSGLTRVRTVVAIGTVAVLALACSSGGDTGSGTGPADADATLRIGYAGPTQSLDPAKQALTSSQPSTFLIYDRLTQLGNDFTVQPMLATSWEFADDGSFLELTLRDGVTFHDGTPVDAAAVKASLDRNRSLPGSTVAASLAEISSVEVVDPATVRLVLTPGGGASLPAVLASNAGEIISPKALTDGRDLALSPGDAGSGPYLVTEFRPNERVIFERAPGEYWDAEAGLPRRIEISYTPSASTRLNALRAGQLELAHIVGPDVVTAEKLAESGAFEVSKVPVLTQQALYLRSTDPALADPRVRRAISLAIDRTAISEQLLSGNCEPLVQPFPKGHWAHTPGLEDRFAHDPAAARQLLAEAGVTGMRFPLAVTAGSSFEPVGQVLQSQLAAVGITVDITPLPSTESDSGYREGRYPAYLGSLAAVADPAQLIRSTYLGGYDAGDAVRDVITPLAEQANDPTLSPDERGALYQQIWTEVAQQGALVNICATKQIWAYSPQVSGADAMPWTWAGNFDARYLGMKS